MVEQADMHSMDAMVQGHQTALDSPRRRVELAAKRALDLIAGTVTLVVLTPLLALLALLVRLESPGHALFSQPRLGCQGQVFPMWKLRSMVDGAPMVLNPDGSTRVVDGDPRVTPLGARLRALGLDELPQLVNILKGDMSLIGPRPDHDFQLAYYAGDDYRKLAMRPGITSLAQVSGRNALPWHARMALEIEYVERFSLLLDLRIAWRTVGVVLRGTGVNNPFSRAESGHRATLLEGEYVGRGKAD